MSSNVAGSIAKAMLWCTGRDQFDDIVYMYMHSLDWDVATNEFDGVCS